MFLSESDTRSKLIDPALYKSGWTETHMRREETVGEVVIIDGKPRRKHGRIDYTLRLRVESHAQPVAVALIEAKAEHAPPPQGIEQAKRYARLLNVPFVFSSNGRLFVEYDFFTGYTSAPQPMAVFPTPAALQARYEQGKGFSLAADAARPLLTPYTGGEANRRYYQDAAIRAVFEHIAQGNNRALLTLATGAGKTYIAVNLLKRIADAGLLRRALFVCDRDELRLQAASAFQNVFGADAATVTSKSAQKNARVVIATYQTLGMEASDADATFLTKHYPPNYFSHIVIDECHRSAWGTWSEVLTRNDEAVQIGLTATPRQIKPPEHSPEVEADLRIQADNFQYFGQPVYEYEMGQAMEDGYLAACEIVKGHVDLDQTGITIEDVLKRNPVSAITGAPVTREELQQIYDKTSYEDRIQLPDRVLAMCEDLFSALIQTGGPEQKTIIFCARDTHAAQVTTTINNLYAAWCAEQGMVQVEPYAFQCTAKSGGAEYLPDFRGSTRHHFIATTVDLLTTGVDVPAVRNVVFFKYVRSPISFYQMVGRGTRLDVPSGKLMFRVYDYTDATRLFGKDFLTRAHKAEIKERPTATNPDPPQPIKVEGFEVHVSEAGRYIVTMVDGKAAPITVDEYKQQVAAKLVAQAPTLDQFRARWITPEERRALLQHLPGGIQAAGLIRELEQLNEYDLYDVLAELGYGMARRTRLERVGAFEYKQADWLQAMPATGAATVRALASQFGKGGTEGLENPQVFQTPEVVKAGGLAALKAVGKPADILRETKERMLAA
jgi:type I restriction enzyme R subunit